MSVIDKKAQGKKNRAAGGAFERRVRADLQAKGWIVDKFSNNINLETDKCIVAKSNRFNMRSMGFPDFIAYKKCNYFNWKIIFVECKMAKYLNKDEKAKSQWYLKNKYCNQFYVASKSKENNKIIITYKEVIIDGST